MTTRPSTADESESVAETLRVLIVEDSADDTEMVLRTLRAEGLAPEALRVWDAEAMRRALEAQPFDIVISDYVMPAFSAPDALRTAKAHDADMPFVAISGTVGEEIAVELMQAGADDYVMKDRLTRLATAVRRALERAAERRALRRAEDALRRSYEDLEHRVEERTAELQVANDELRAQQQALAAASDALSVARDRYQDLFDSAPVAYLVTDGEGTIRSANRAARELLGHAHVSPATRDLGAYVSPASIGAYRNALKHGGRDGAPQRCELRLRPAGSEGRERLVACTAAAEGTAHGGEGLLRWVLHDVTEERELEERLATSARFPSENPDPVLRVDRDGTLLYANTASAGLLEKWGAHVGRRLPEEWRQAVQAALEQGAMWRMEAAAGDTTYDLILVPLPGQGYVNIYGGDVTERVKAQQQILRQQALLAAINRVFERAITCETADELRRTCVRVAMELTESQGGLFSEVIDGELAGDVTVSGLHGTQRLSGSAALQRHMMETLADAGLDSDAIARGRSILKNQAPGRFSERLPGDHPPVAAFLAVPLRRRRRTVGVIVVSDRPNGFDREQQEDIEALAPAIEEALYRRSTEDALRESEAQLRALVEASSEAMYRMGPDWREMRHLDGGGFLADTDRPNGTWIEEYILPEDRPHVNAAIQEAIRTKSAFQLEHRVRRADGGVGWTFSRAVPILDAEGEITEWFGAASDVTQRRQAEDALRESEARYRTLFESMDEAFAIHEMLYDENGEPVDYRWLHVNPAFEQQTGLSGVEGRTALEVIPQLEEHWIDTYGRVVQTGEPVRIESYTAPLDRWYGVHAFRYGRPEEHRFAALFRDISERKRADDALRKSEGRLAAELAAATQLQRVSTQLIQADDADALYAQILDTAVELHHADIASLQMLEVAEDGQRRLRLLGNRGFSEAAARHWEWVTANTRTTCGAMLGTGQRVIAPDLERCAFMAGSKDCQVLRNDGIRASQTTPLYSRSGALLGAISTHWRQPHEPTEGELRAIDVLARQAADLIERRQAEAETQRRLQHLSALYDGSQVLLGEPSAQDVLERACHLAVDRFGLTMAWAGLMPEKPGQPLTPTAAAGHEANWAQRLVFSVDDAGGRYPVHRAIRDREPVVVDVARDEDLHPEWRAEALARGYRFMAVLPLIRRQGVVGVLAVKAGAREALDTEQMQALRLLANLAAIGVRKARMFEELERHADRLEEEVRDRTESLRESVALFRAIFDGAASGIGLLDEEGRLFAWNPALDLLLTAPDRRIQDHVFADLLVDPEGREAFREAHRALLLPGGEPTQLEARYRGAGGKVRWANMLLSMVRDSAGTPRFGLAVVDDVTDMRMAQQALLHAEKLSATGKLAASFAHEIKNPLQSVIGCLGLAREAAASGENAERYFEVAHDELLRANDLVSQLRNLNLRADIANREPIEPAALVDRVHALIQKQARDLAVQVRTDVAEGLPAVPVAADAMQQVLLNLTLNALEAMPEGGDLCLRAEAAPNGEVALRVQDTGVGIPPEDLEHIFEGFYSTKENGLGLGIFISQSIVRQHGGRIEVDSQVGEGTTFSILLPV